MLYIFSLLYIIIKGLAFVLNNEILFYLSYKNFFFLSVLICTIMLCKKALKYKKFFMNIADYFIQYRFKSRTDFYYSISIVGFSIVNYIIIIIYLRIRTFNNPMDLYIVYCSLQELCFKYPKGILFYNAFILFLIIYLFFLCIKLIKKRLNIHLTKIHFYFMSFNRYLKIHHYFDHYLSVHALIVGNISHIYKFCVKLVFSLYLFGYYKNDFYRDMDEEDLPKKTKRYIWTLEDKQLYKSLRTQCNSFLFALDSPLKGFFYNLHFFLLILTIMFDVIYNDGVLKHVAWILPILFLYQIYVWLSQFVTDKVVFDVSAEINTLYYKDVTYIDDKLMVFEGELFQRPNYEQIITEFMQYESTEFYWTRIKR